MDMDAFYASIEERDNPELVGKPVVVGGSSRRGVVATANYEARKYGIHSAMPGAKAARLCPHAIFIKPRMEAYVEASRLVMEVLDTYSPLVEPLSLDEAFLDMTGTENLFGPPLETAQRLKDDIRAATQLTCSVGVAPNKFLAKLASDLDKPDGITHIPHGQEAEFIAPLPIRKIWGVGPKAAARLQGLGLDTIGDIAAADPDWLRRHLGSFADHIQPLSRGEDFREVVGGGRRKSIGSENTLSIDIRGREAIEKELRRHLEDVTRTARKKNLKAKSVRVKVRYSKTFQLQTRQGALPSPADDSRTIFPVACSLLDTLDLDEPIRLVGAALFDFVHEGEPAQQSLFGAQKAKNSELERTLDAIRDKFGDKINRGVQGPEAPNPKNVEPNKE